MTEIARPTTKWNRWPARGPRTSQAPSLDAIEPPEEEQSTVASDLEGAFVDLDAVVAEEPVHLGGGWYQLSTGEKVRGLPRTPPAEV